MKMLTYFILSNASLTHCFWLIPDYFAQIWVGGLWTHRVHPAVCPHGLPWELWLVVRACVGRTGGCSLQGHTFHTLWAPTSLQPRWDSTSGLPPCTECDLGAPLGPALADTALERSSAVHRTCPELPAQALCEAWRMRPLTAEPEITKVQTHSPTRSHPLFLFIKMSLVLSLETCDPPRLALSLSV